MRVRLALEPPEGLNGRSAQITGPITGSHYCAVDCGDDVNPCITAFDLESNILSYLFRGDKLHLVGCGYGLKFASSKEPVLPGVHPHHLQLAQLLKSLFGNGQLDPSLQPLAPR